MEIIRDVLIVCPIKMNFFFMPLYTSEACAIFCADSVVHKNIFSSIWLYVGTYGYVTKLKNVHIFSYCGLHNIDLSEA